jgi:hypothetical protein
MSTNSTPIYEIENEAERLNAYYDIAGNHIRGVLERECPSIEGWLHTVAAFAIPLINSYQELHRISGSVAEIGVWHGKTFVLFSYLLSSNEMLVGFDIDIKSEANTNLQSRCSHKESCLLVQADSMTLKPATMQSHLLSMPRIFHVDGYHSFSVALNDLRLAFESTSEAGVIIVDDFFSATVPGVTDAFYKLSYEKHNNGFVPFALGGGKVFLCQEKLVSEYSEYLLKFMPVKPRIGEEVDYMLGNRIAIFEME